MIKRLSILCCLMLSFGALAQYDINDNKDTTAKESKIDRIDILSRTYVGGELGLQFGTGASRIYLAPIIGYDIFKPLSVGVSGMYQLFRQTAFNGASVNYHTYGGGVFVRYRPINMLILQTELNVYNTEDFTQPFGTRTNVPAFMAGLGYAGDFGGRAYYQAILMYDFVQDINMPLPPIFGLPIYLRLGLVFYLGERNY